MQAQLEAKGDVSLKLVIDAGRRNIDVMAAVHRAPPAVAPPLNAPMAMLASRVDSDQAM